MNITFDKTEGEGNMPAVEVVKGSKYKLPESTFTAPAEKEFDKWSVKIGSAPAEGKQPGDEITASDNVTDRYRVHQAQRLLRDTERTVLDIGLEVGFYDGGYFSRIFRQIVGVSPEK